MKYFFLLLISFFSSIVSAQPKMKADTSQYNLGNIIQGTPLKYEFYVTNTGNKPLIIERVSTGDGGSMADWEKEPIAPGSKGKIRFIYDTQRIGPFSRTVYINSNVEYGHLTVSIKGEVIYDPMPISTSVSEIDLGKIPYDSIVDFSFTVKSAGKKPVHFTPNTYNYAEYDLFSIESKSLDSLTYDRPIGNEYEVKGKLINKYGNSGSFSHQIQFIYNSHDTLYFTVKGKFVSDKPVLTHREFIFRQGSCVYIYQNSCLKEVIDSDQTKMRRHYFFEGTNCVRIIDRDYNGGYKTTEYSKGKSIKVE